MNWNTTYITGNIGFWEDVNSRLSGSDVHHMIGSMERLPDAQCRGLYWLAEKESVENFKRAIGAKLIWKYRLRFETEPETTAVKNQNTAFKERFTERERSLIQKMRLKTRKRAIVK